ncbi:MAG: hypothetical protein VX835_00405 [Pseudomonadota bacterium]|nr:hypothetical protein [Pseudomonadota bacterium]
MSDKLISQLSGDHFTFSELSLLLSRRYECKINLPLVHQRLNELWQGKKVNFTENKRAMFIAQRQYKQNPLGFEDAVGFLETQDETMLRLVESYKGIKHIICVGVGGSSWGVQCLHNALKTTLTRVSDLTFVDHCDMGRLKSDISSLSPETTLVVYISKSGSTHEVNWAFNAIGQIWHSYKRVLITANKESQVDFEVSDAETLLIHDEINGRMSIWSPVIFPILLAYGKGVLDDFRAGAVEMDFAMQSTSNVYETVPGRLANAWMIEQAQFAQPTMWMLTYASLLDGFGPYVQQLMMESLGKPFNKKNEKLSKPSGPIIMPMTGHQAQHAAMQYLHQSDEPFMVHAVTLDSQKNVASNRHLCAQYKAMTDKADVLEQDDESQFSNHKSFHNPNKAVSILSIGDVNPRSIGMLVAMYEYVTLIMGFHADINPFDQFGVERPKAIMRLEVCV